MAWKIVKKAKVVKCNETGKVGISTGCKGEVVPIGGAGGGAEMFVCNIESLGDEMRADKTEAELREAYASGKIVKVYYLGTECVRMGGVYVKDNDSKPLKYICFQFDDTNGEAPTSVVAKWFIFTNGLITVKTGRIGT